MSRTRSENEERSIPVRLPEHCIKTLDEWASEAGTKRGTMIRSMILEIIRDTEESENAARTR